VQSGWYRGIFRPRFLNVLYFLGGIMKFTGLNELREMFLSFFESKAHYRLESFPLLPIDDDSLLLINSGMAPMKKYFLGKETPPSKRVTTCQKCIRTPDIENVGKTSRHGTYFEMLGNFSFGDYFKHEATAWAWEFITNVLEIPVDRIYVSVYFEDDEAVKIWTQEVGVPEDRIVRLGKDDNFWEIGSGPCGPCSEIYFDRGEKYGCGKPDCAPGCDCDRYVEFWNLVFSQFDSDGEGHYTPMEHPNIDTGMGLERLACIMQGVDNLFEVDTVQNILQHAARIAGVEYKKDEKTDISIRVITDHIRSVTFMLCDGIKPSNEGRGYVLKRLLRRAARHGRLLGIVNPFLFELCETVIEENKKAYPELVSKKDYIVKSIKNEEEVFLKTIDKGIEMLESYMDKNSSSVIPGDVAFKLYDTYGFPVDLTADIASERNMTVDETGFEKLMQQQKERARKARQDSNIIGWKDDALDYLNNKNSEFIGYESYECESKVVAILKDSEITEKAYCGDDVVIVLDKTPFYAESGGQVADTGKLVFEGADVKVYDCKKDSLKHFLHIAHVESGSIQVGDKCRAVIDADRRNAIKRNHTSAHLLQAALRLVLGDHVHQAGSYVDAERLRFDFTHFSAVNSEELQKIENIVNAKILEGINVENYETDFENAKGAMALFGEKYGARVRVCKVGDFSYELCGGTHIENTGKIGLFKIISEGSVSSGVRRIEAVTGYGILSLISQYSDLLGSAASALKVNGFSDIVPKCVSLNDELKKVRSELAAAHEKAALAKSAALFDNSVEICGIKVLSGKLMDTDSKTARAICDDMRAKHNNFTAVIAAVDGAKATLHVVCSDEAVKKGAHAGKIVGEIAALTDGKGGGKSENATAGIGNTEKIEAALSAAADIVKKFIVK
jgi:alanyl-tRNA synthetase